MIAWFGNYPIYQVASANVTANITDLIAFGSLAGNGMRSLSAVFLTLISPTLRNE